VTVRLRWSRWRALKGSFDAAGNLYIADTDGFRQNRVRRLSTTGNLTTVAGSPTIINTSDQGFSGDGHAFVKKTLRTPPLEIELAENV
jgi:hypothetical protein